MTPCVMFSSVRIRRWGVTCARRRHAGFDGRDRGPRRYRSRRVCRGALASRAMTLVTLDSWMRLEERLHARWSCKKSDEASVRSSAWAGWCWCDERQVIDSIPYLAQQVAARRRREAAAELPRMRLLPAITPADEVALLIEQRRFGIPAEIIRPEDRCLLGVPLLGDSARGILAHVAGRLSDHRWPLLGPFGELVKQAEEHREAEAVRLLALEDEHHASRRDSVRGPAVAVVRA